MPNDQYEIINPTQGAQFKFRNDNLSVTNYDPDMQIIINGVTIPTTQSTTAVVLEVSKYSRFTFTFETTNSVVAKIQVRQIATGGWVDMWNAPFTSNSLFDFDTQVQEMRVIITNAHTDVVTVSCFLIASTR